MMENEFDKIVTEYRCITSLPLADITPIALDTITNMLYKLLLEHKLNQSIALQIQKMLAVIIAVISMKKTETQKALQKLSFQENKINKYYQAMSNFT